MSLDLRYFEGQGTQSLQLYVLLCWGMLVPSAVFMTFQGLDMIQRHTRGNNVLPQRTAVHMVGIIAREEAVAFLRVAINVAVLSAAEGSDWGSVAHSPALLVVPRLPYISLLRYAVRAASMGRGRAADGARTWCRRGAGQAGSSEGDGGRDGEATATRCWVALRCVNDRARALVAAVRGLAGLWLPGSLRY